MLKAEFRLWAEVASSALPFPQTNNVQIYNTALVLFSVGLGTLMIGMATRCSYQLRRDYYFMGLFEMRKDANISFHAQGEYRTGASSPSQYIETITS